MPAWTRISTARPGSVPCPPVSVGKTASRVAVICHTLAFLLFTLTGLVMHLNGWYYLGIVLTAAALFYQHLIVKPDDLSRIKMSFFSMNGLIALTLFLSTCLALATA